MAGGAEVGLDRRHGLAVALDPQGEARLLAGHEVALDTDVEAGDARGPGRLRPGGGEVTGDVDGGGEGHPFVGVGRGGVGVEAVGAGGLPGPRQRPRAVGGALRVDVAEVLAVAAYDDQVQLLLVLDGVVGDRVAVGVGDRQLEAAALVDLGRGGDVGEAVAVLLQRQARGCGGAVVGGVLVVSVTGAVVRRGGVLAAVGGALLRPGPRGLLGHDRAGRDRGEREDDREGETEETETGRGVHPQALVAV